MMRSTAGSSATVSKHHQSSTATAAATGMRRPTMAPAPAPAASLPKGGAPFAARLVPGGGGGNPAAPAAVAAAGPVQHQGPFRTVHPLQWNLIQLSQMEQRESSQVKESSMERRVDIILSRLRTSLARVPNDKLDWVNAIKDDSCDISCHPQHHQHAAADRSLPMPLILTNNRYYLV